MLAAMIAAVGSAAVGSGSTSVCDIFEAGGTPCVAAHSVTRALYATYNGPLCVFIFEFLFFLVLRDRSGMQAIAHA
jgi:dephospho-CoA kinase